MNFRAAMVFKFNQSTSFPLRMNQVFFFKKNAGELRLHCITHGLGDMCKFIIFVGLLRTIFLARLETSRQLATAPDVRKKAYNMAS